MGTNVTPALGLRRLCDAEVQIMVVVVLADVAEAGVAVTDAVDGGLRDVQWSTYASLLELC